MKRLVFLVNTPEFFLSHRLPIAIKARNKGYDVHIATGSGDAIGEIKELGFRYHYISITRSGQNVFAELKTLKSIYSLFKLLQPDVVHLVTIKPVLYGGLIARITGVKSVVAAISGLGSVFLAESVVKKVRRWIVIKLYKEALKHKRLRVIFQNPDDRDLFTIHRIVAKSNTKLIRGSGVDLSEYAVYPEPIGRPVVSLAARLLKDKGVFDFVEAGRLLKSRSITVDMRLIGDRDPGNPSSVSESDISLWQKEGVIDVQGFKESIAQEYAKSNIVCLPSYREGLPKSLIEAAACGRAVITTDVPGCRDAIAPDVSGLLVSPKDPTALANAIEYLVKNPNIRVQMGKRGRQLAEKEFSVEKVIDEHISIYDELTKNV
ncbi:glycosyltransferase family 4 protein [Idiomarina abyssalis]|uniref:Glycosyltransferase family 4 protein n=1 Tax=Idiomarina abyssalis TaxID=86102 RepID=A0A8I1GAH4_9GAMM|nr:glycosyltransferase family 4 protein [Idiomarina abyssalis]MBJ7265765.1 glycosyltransferase family 4 protein [Idiomarina abyssalis]MBJ7274018.1 glycosyltransferase family 4 protein [Idiomarina abyssalis]MBJ7314876.1 glycosyltransferase family 4 protein [Idiomarina abyssalis]